MGLHISRLKNHTLEVLTNLMQLFLDWNYQKRYYAFLKFKGLKLEVKVGGSKKALEFYIHHYKIP